ncbi:MAG: cupin domain-containing protein [Gemmatimonadota bacterium]
MSQPAVIVRNWRQARPEAGHDSAIIWAMLRRRSGGSLEPWACLEHLSGFVLHTVQGGMSSNLHQHDKVEQFYFVVSGRGEALIGERRYAVRAGSAAYLPPAVPHQFFADPQVDRVEHLVVSCPVERQGSPARVVSWREVVPRTGDHGDAVIWPLLESMDEAEPQTPQPCLLGFHYLTQQGLVRGKASDRHQHDDKEQVYYVVEGRGAVIAGEAYRPIGEGDAVYLPRGLPHQILNEAYDGWLTYLIVS